MSPRELFLLSPARPLAAFQLDFQSGIRGGPKCSDGGLPRSAIPSHGKRGLGGPASEEERTDLRIAWGD